MAPRSSNNNSSSNHRTVRVDVTAHKEERNVTDTRKKSSLRARYYVELVVGSVHERHVRLGFSGSFKSLLELHQSFLRAYLDKYGSGSEHLTRASLSSSTSSTTSRSSLSSSSPRGVKKLMHTFRLKQHIPTEPNAINHFHSTRSRSSSGGGGHGNQRDDIALPYMPAFPASSKLLVKFESGAATDDNKISARVTALFEYYTQLFNSEERELFLEIVQLRSIEEAERQAAENNNNNSGSSHNYSQGRAFEPPVPDVQSTRGGLFKFLTRHSLTKSASSRDDPFKRLEFSPPVQVSSSGKARPLKHVKVSGELSASRFR